MFQIKICGVTSREDAEGACAAGADAIGFNFYENSPRFVQLSDARKMIEVVPSQVCKVGVFVNDDVARICDVFDELQLDAIQLHGDEPPPFLGLLGNRSIIRAFRCRDSGIEPVVEYLEKCSALGCVPQCVLMDAYYPGQYGGTGKVFDWTMVKGSSQKLYGAQVVLAGGLTADNVDKAIATAMPKAVDTASGVESSPGVKDMNLVQSFVRRAAAAFQEIGH